MSLATEEEQLDALKKLWNSYGKLLVTVFAIVLVASMGWRYWQGKQADKQAAASIVFQEIIHGQVQNDLDSQKNNAAILLNDYKNTIYAVFAAFKQAQLAVNNGDFDVAYVQLNWVVEHAKDKAFVDLARIRMARIELARDAAPAALKILGKVKTKAFNPLLAEVQGDAYLALGEKAKARAAYILALQSAPELAGQRPILQMKLNELAEPQAMVAQQDSKQIG